MQNGVQQARNVADAFSAQPGDALEGPVLLVDDMVDSRWSLTVCGVALAEAGSGPVYPIALAQTTRGRVHDDVPISADGQAIALACSALALETTSRPSRSRPRSGTTCPGHCANPSSNARATCSAWTLRSRRQRWA